MNQKKLDEHVNGHLELALSAVLEIRTAPEGNLVQVRYDRLRLALRNMAMLGYCFAKDQARLGHLPDNKVPQTLEELLEEEPVI